MSHFIKLEFNDNSPITVRIKAHPSATFDTIFECYSMKRALESNCLKFKFNDSFIYPTNSLSDLKMTDSNITYSICVSK